ncbi:enoyl-CoA hydratase-isomerase [Pseudomonas saudimassiliensis]|uniref:Enoyl-CoA hydratase-isomerase n=1 Tax=Pseudomonas saudimassiliensis TaxID=1461581 RepID=A0A078M597_9PSED|nr:enoyl-CoA hydratase family protein [Pseudomonas saudimassiliensis]CEA02613.1 enoyl-CoA hydratase-isomerase [Pseudomonas saudimassiliensis]CEF25892.1 enoyl-CoA hydratase-isomerase [Pseudomonas saudimassiliensis]
MNPAFNVEINQGIAELVINKPPVNALDSNEWLALAAQIDALGANPEVRVLILRSEGRGFCAGVDIKELDAHPERIVRVNAGNYATFKAIHRCAVPVIVAVHGFVLGGGIGMAGAADILIASRCATFAVPEVDRGAMGGGAHLQRLFPVQKVRYMYFTGETVSAPDAMQYGFIERLVERDELAATARDVAAKIAAKSPAMIRIAKEALNGIEDGNLEDKYRWEQGFTLEAYTMPDSAETRRAFVEKRDASF